MPESYKMEARPEAVMGIQPQSIQKNSFYIMKGELKAGSGTQEPRSGTKGVSEKR